MRVSLIQKFDSEDAPQQNRLSAKGGKVRPVKTPSYPPETNQFNLV